MGNAEHSTRVQRAGAPGSSGRGPGGAVGSRAAKAACALTMIVAMMAVLSPAAVSSGAADAHVSIVYRAYQPATTTVTVGQTVTWTNTALIPHTVTATGGTFDSGKLDPQKSFSVTFTTAGEYLYACMIHPSMKGTVIVRSAQPPGGPGAGAPQSLQVHLASRHGSHGNQTVVHVQAPRPGARVLLQGYRGSTWRALAQTRLSTHGSATLIASSSDRRLRVVVLGQPGKGALLSRALRAPA